MGDLTSILSLLIAALAVFVGPFISLNIARRQTKSSLEIANKQIVAPMRQAWINNLRDDVAELMSSALHYFVAGFEDRSDKEYQRLEHLEHKLRLMLNPEEDDHNALEDHVRTMIASLERGKQEDQLFIINYDAALKLSRVIFKREWDRIKEPMRLHHLASEAGAMPAFGFIRPTEVGALMISVFALSFSGLQWYEARDQRLLAAHAAVTFLVDADATQKPLGVAIKNAGPGVAEIRSITYYVDRKKVKDLDEAFAMMHLDPDHNFGYQLDEDEPLAPGESLPLIDYRTKDKGELARAGDFIDTALAVEVYVCVRTGQCWLKCSYKDHCGK